MRRFFRRIGHLYWLLLSLLVRCFTCVRKKRILCWSYHYTKYSCNPRYITEFLLKEHPNEFEIYWCFKNDVNVDNLPKEIKVVRWRTWRYLIILNTSSFLFTNARTDLWGSSFVKKKGQKYIMTWHSSMGIKKVEKDAENELPERYIKNAQYDSSMCDLILSGCRFRTEVIKRAFWYGGEILEGGTPRNDILFNEHTQLKTNIFTHYGIPHDAKILLYAPTFRKDLGLEYYKFNWNDVLPMLEEKFGAPMFVFLRLHPNFCTNKIAIPDLCKDERIRDLTYYHDMHELLCISDILVTDYSSSLFDFALLNKPCFIYAKDYETYERGTYFKLDELPFPFATTDLEFGKRIAEFDNDKYRQNLSYFNKEVIGSYEDGHACERVYGWMKSKKNNIAI